MTAERVTELYLVWKKILLSVVKTDRYLKGEPVTHVMEEPRTHWGT